MSPSGRNTPVSAAQVVTWKNLRRAAKGQLTQIHTEISTIANNPVDVSLRGDLKDLLARLDTHWETVKKMTDRVIDQIDPADVNQIDDEIKKRDDTEKTVSQAKTVAGKVLDAIKEEKRKAAEDSREKEMDKQAKRMEDSFKAILLGFATQASTTQAQATTATTSQPKPKTFSLPNLPVKPFSGDLLEWTAFWEGFQSTIDSSVLTDSEKMNYLVGYLRGEALLAVQHLGRTAASYAEAKRQLDQLYNRKSALIEAHLKKLENLPVISSANDIAGLRNLHLSIESHVYALEKLGKKSDSYETLLGPRIMRSMPPVMREKYADDATNEITDYKKILAFLIAQTGAKERSLRWQNQDDQPPQTPQQPQQQQQQRQGRKRNKHSQQGSSPAPQQQTPSAGALAAGTKQASTPRGATRGSTPTDQKKAPGRCLFCPETHWANKCPIPTKTKIELVQKEKRCYRCLNSRHAIDACTKQWTCWKCGSSDHHAALCQARRPDESPRRPPAASISTVAPTPGDVLIKTATVTIQGPTGEKRAICLVDDGSQRSYIRRQLADELELDVVGQEALCIYAFGSKLAAPPESLNKRRFLVKGTFPGAPLLELTALDKEEISTISPYVKSDLARKLKRDGRRLADDRFFGGDVDSPEIDLLIGADHLWSICGKETIAGSCGLRAVDSKFGWLLIGPAAPNPAGSAVVALLTRSEQKQPLALLSSATALTSQVRFAEKPEIITVPSTDRQEEKESSPQLPYRLEGEDSPRGEGFDMQLFWKIDRMGIFDDPTSYSKIDLLKEYLDSIGREEDGRYNAALTWKANKWQLENNYALAERRLNGLLNRLRRTPVLLQAYHEEMNQLVEKGFAEEADLGYDGLHTYLPHHPVIREDKATSKIRPVFDGSARGRYGPSLNDCLETGPNLNPDLFAVLMRFRLKRIAWIADIEKAFLNIALPEEDSNAVRFLWTKDPTDPTAPKIALRWKRVPFGLNCSPFLLRATILKHLNSHRANCRDLINDIEAQLYVDDLLGGAHTVEEAVKAIHNTRDIFGEAKLKMTKWTTSSPELRQVLAKEGLSLPAEGVLANTLSAGNTKVLGVSWDTETDSFMFNPTDIVEAANTIGDEPTKRNILQVTSKIFDPMGFLGPTVLSLKMLFQKLWEANIGWDEAVPPDIKETWKKTIAGLQGLDKLRIPRWLSTGPQDVNKPTELHVFGDASEGGYGAVAYIRQEINGVMETNFLCSKTVVAPLPKKEVSLPRLELLSSLLAVKLGEAIKNAMTDRIWTTTYWSDSKVALGWIKGNSSRWQLFVKNRVDKIQRDSDPSWWRHCPGIDNPADLASRGATAEALINSKLWWEGPPWLVKEKANWPTDKDYTISEDEEFEIASERKRTVTITLAGVNTVDERRKGVDWELDRISHWNQLIRRAAWMQRFGRYGRLDRPEDEVNGKTRVRTNFNGQLKEHWLNCLRAEEIREAELFILRGLQQECYPESYAALENKETLHQKNKILKLRPVWDGRDRLIRVTGRMELAIREEQLAPPILLPPNHPILDLLIRYTHERLLHAGVRSVHAELRERFWIVRGRQQVRGVLGRCVTCKKLQSPPFDELAAPIPVERIRRARPFDQCGVDFAGPLYYKPYTYKKETKTKPAEGGSSDPPQPGTRVPPPQTDETPQPAEGATPTITATAEGVPAPQESQAAGVPPPTPPRRKAPRKKRPKKNTDNAPEPQKAYICLFTCAYTRAIHLELVRDLTAETFILALRRFFNATGGCTRMFSDNAKTFSCVSNYLRVMRTNNSICDMLARNKVEWKFSAALAPWWGGFWERMVRTVKQLFRKANGKAVLNFDQLHTALTDVQAVVNARPLVYVADGDDDPKPLIPNHLLYGHPTPGGPDEGPPPDPVNHASAQALIKMDKDRRKFVSDCVERFVKEYLGELTLFHSKGRAGRKIRLGEVVVIHDAQAKRLLWSTGVVKELLVGRDGRVRSAKVKIPSGSILTRAIQSLYPIELQEDQPDDQPDDPPNDTLIAPEQEREADQLDPPTEPQQEPDIQPPQDQPTPTDYQEESLRDSGGENVENPEITPAIFERRPGARRIRLTERARAHFQGDH